MYCELKGKEELVERISDKLKKLLEHCERNAWARTPIYELNERLALINTLLEVPDSIQVSFPGFSRSFRVRLQMRIAAWLRKLADKIVRI